MNIIKLLYLLCIDKKDPKYGQFPRGKISKSTLSLFYEKTSDTCAYVFQLCLLMYYHLYIHILYTYTHKHVYTHTH